MIITTEQVRTYTNSFVFVLGDDYGGATIATVIHLAMCPTSASLFLHSYVFCEEPPVVDHVAIIEVIQGAP